MQVVVYGSSDSDPLLLQFLRYLNLSGAKCTEIIVLAGEICKKQTDRQQSVQPEAVEGPFASPSFF